MPNKSGQPNERLDMIFSNEEYHEMGYNGFWDGYWESSIQAIKQLRIEHNPQAFISLTKGWNKAVIEQQYEQQYENT